MSKLDALTENRYTTDDIFKKNYQIWALIPLFLYMIAPLIHMPVYAYGFSTEITDEWIPIFLTAGTLPGDYFKEIIHFIFLIGAVFAFIAVLSYFSRKKQVSLQRKPDYIPTIIFCVYLVFALISSIVNKTSVDYLMGYTARSEGVLSLCAYYLIFYLCGSLVSKEKYKYFLSYFFLSIGFLIGVLSVINHFCVHIKIFTEFDFNGRLLPAGIFYTHNFYAYYLAISIMLAAGLVVFDKCKWRKALSFVIFALDTFILALNDTMGAFLAIIVAFAFFIFFVLIRDKKFSFKLLGLFALFIAIIFVVGLFTQSFLSELTGLVSDVETIAAEGADAEDAGTARWGLWTHTWQYIKEKPWIGWGFEGTAERLADETNQSKVHNEYLENMANFGIPAGLIYIAALMSVYIKAIKRRKHVDDITLVCLVGALGYIGSALVGNSLIFTAPYCFIFLGLGSTTVHNPDIKELESGPAETVSDEINESVTAEIIGEELTETAEDEAAEVADEEPAEVIGEQDNA